jgi:hypothetical protein
MKLKSGYGNKRGVTEAYTPRRRTEESADYIFDIIDCGIVNIHRMVVAGLGISPVFEFVICS